MTQAAEAVPNDDGFGNHLNLVDTSVSDNEYEALGSGDGPETDDIDRPEMVYFSYVHPYVLPTFVADTTYVSYVVHRNMNMSRLLMIH